VELYDVFDLHLEKAMNFGPGPGSHGAARADGLSAP
jgi:hypothetical protein